MTKEMTDAEFIRSVRNHALFYFTDNQKSRLLSIAAKLEQDTPPVRDVPEIVGKLRDYIYHWESRSQSAYSLAHILIDHFEKDAK